MPEQLKKFINQTLTGADFSGGTGDTYPRVTTGANFSNYGNINHTEVS